MSRGRFILWLVSLPIPGVILFLLGATGYDEVLFGWVDSDLFAWFSPVVFLGAHVVGLAVAVAVLYGVPMRVAEKLLILVGTVGAMLVLELLPLLLFLTAMALAR